MKAIRESEWFAVEQPTVKVSPHATGGLGSMRVVFAGTPRSRSRRSTRSRPPARAGRRGDPSRRPVRPGPPAGREPGRPARRGARCPGAQARPPARPGVPGRAAELAPDCCPVVAYGALLPQSRSTSPARLGQPALLVLPAWRAPPRSSTPLGRRRGDRCDDLPDRASDLDAGPTFGVMTERIRPRHRRRPARPAGRGRGRAAGRHPRRDRGRHPRGARAAADGVSWRPRSPSRTPRSTGASRRRRRPADPGLHPGPGAWTTCEGERVKLGPVTPRPPTTPSPSPACSR